MKKYKYLSDDIVAEIDEDGISRRSGLVSIVPKGAVILPADPIELPEVAQSVSVVDQIINDQNQLARLKSALGL